MGTEPETQPTPTDTLLGDWYANLIRVGRLQMVLAISERTLLPVVVPAKESRTLARRMGEALEPLLLSIGIPTEDVLAERGAMRGPAIGKTANRRVLGSLNDLAFQLEVGLVHFPERTLLEHALWLAKTPLKVIEYGSPDLATVAAFAARRALKQASTPAPG
jgi:hypothetical protein